MSTAGCPQPGEQRILMSCVLCVGEMVLIPSKLSSYLIHVPVTTASSDLELWPSGDQILGNIWGHCGLSQLRGMWGGDHRYLVGGGLRYCRRPAMHRTALATESYLAPQAKGEKLWCRPVVLHAADTPNQLGSS